MPEGRYSKETVAELINSYHMVNFQKYNWLSSLKCNFLDVIEIEQDVVDLVLSLNNNNKRFLLERYKEHLGKWMRPKLRNPSH